MKATGLTPMSTALVSSGSTARMFLSVTLTADLDGAAPVATGNKIELPIAAKSVDVSRRWTTIAPGWAASSEKHVSSISFVNGRV